MLENWQEHSFVRDNAREGIAENWSAQLDKSELIQKSKRLENTCKTFMQLLGNSFNAKCVVYLIQTQECQPHGGVIRSYLTPTASFGRSF